VAGIGVAHGSRATPWHLTARELRHVPRAASRFPLAASHVPPAASRKVTQEKPSRAKRDRARAAFVPELATLR
jgi:hypothetical protein